MFQKLDYRDVVRRLNARHLFDMYKDLIVLIQGLNPELFRQAANILKSERKAEFELKDVDRIRQLYPNDIPDVFTRLWSQERGHSAKDILKAESIL